MAWFHGIAAPKPEPRTRTKARAKRVHRGDVAEVRVYVFGRERHICRCCRLRPAESMHERIARSLGGKVSKQNSMAVCGDGVQGCHGLLQRHEIACDAVDQGCEGTLTFLPLSTAACEWMKLAPGELLLSEPMLVMESAE
jgi:hypothetical protein